jgi:ribosomal protein S18 acetylase RimI-like enzyme
MNLAVRRIRLTDLPTLERFEAHMPRPPGIREHHLEVFRSTLEDALSREPEGFLVADSGGMAVGAVVARVRGAHAVTGVLFGRIEALVVSPAHPSVGIGDRLLKEGEAYLRSRGCQTLGVTLRANESTHAELFRNAGYRVAAWELERS